MMTLIALAISVAFAFSLAVTLGFDPKMNADELKAWTRGNGR